MSIRSYKIAEVAIRVSDLAVSEDFYRNIMGFKFHKRLPEVVFLEVGPLDSPLGAVDHPALFALFKRDRPLNVAESSFDHIAFEVPPEDFAAERARYAEMGMVISERSCPDSLPWNGNASFFRDPDGNVIEIIAANR